MSSSAGPIRGHFAKQRPLEKKAPPGMSQEPFYQTCKMGTKPRLQLTLYVLDEPLGPTKLGVSSISKVAYNTHGRPFLSQQFSQVKCQPNIYLMPYVFIELFLLSTDTTRKDMMKKIQGNVKLAISRQYKCHADIKQTCHKLHMVTGKRGRKYYQTITPVAPRSVKIDNQNRVTAKETCQQSRNKKNNNKKEEHLSAILQKPIPPPNIMILQHSNSQHLEDFNTNLMGYINKKFLQIQEGTP